MKLNFSKEDFNKNKDNIMFNEDFVKNNFPNKRKENWKFTDLEKILNFKFKELSVYNKKIQLPLMKNCNLIIII